MYTNEFNEWLRYHCAAFTGILPWFKKQPDIQETKGHWERTLIGIDLKEAKEATDIMMRDENEIPEGYSLHPSRIRRICRSGRQRDNSNGDGQQYIHGQRVYDCPLCLDKGFVSVWHYDTIEQLKSGRPIEWPRDNHGRIARSQIPSDELPVARNSMGILCNCRKGVARKETGGRWRRTPVYDKDKFYLHDGSGDLSEVIEGECHA